MVKCIFYIDINRCCYTLTEKKMSILFFCMKSSFLIGNIREKSNKFYFCYLGFEEWKSLVNKDFYDIDT